MNPYFVEPDLSGAGLHIGIVRSRFNESIGQTALEACLQALASLGVDESDVMVVSVPGALELGVTLSHMAETLEFDALIALGAVIRGETYHFEVVSNEMAAAISQIALSTGIPIANGVLTTDTDEQAQARAAAKGRDCAHVAVEMANLMLAIQPEQDDDDEEEDIDDEEDDRS
jgi:6,7-dimethyl-8-ribityllumazine synthase